MTIDDRQDAEVIAVRERVARDLSGLTPAAQARYRQALRRLRAEVRDGSGADRVAVAATGGRNHPRNGGQAAMWTLGAAALSGAAVLADPVLGGFGAALALALAALAREGRIERVPASAGQRMEGSAAAALNLHLEAMALSRRSYYVGPQG
jgi:hypothetical protein